MLKRKAKRFEIVGIENLINFYGDVDYNRRILVVRDLTSDREFGIVECDGKGIAVIGLKKNVMKNAVRRILYHLKRCLGREQKGE